MCQLNRPLSARPIPDERGRQLQNEGDRDIKLLQNENAALKEEVLQLRALYRAVIERQRAGKAA